MEGGINNYLTTGNHDSYSGMMTFRARGNFFAGTLFCRIKIFAGGI